MQAKWLVDCGKRDWGGRDGRGVGCGIGISDGHSDLGTYIHACMGVLYLVNANKVKTRSTTVGEVQYVV